MNIGRYIGLPYQDKGRTFAGVDCYGICFLFLSEELQLQIPSYTDDYRDAKHKVSVSDAFGQYSKKWQRVSSGWTLGDVVVFNLGGKPLHCGLLINKNDFLHCLEGTQSCLERLNSVTWSSRIEGVYRWTN